MTQCFKDDRQNKSDKESFSVVPQVKILSFFVFFIFYVSGNAIYDCTTCTVGINLCQAKSRTPLCDSS